MAEETKVSKKVSKETDLLRYEGNSFPRILRLLWTVLFVFSFIYLVRYMWPDLKFWLTR